MVTPTTQPTRPKLTLNKKPPQEVTFLEDKESVLFDENEVSNTLTSGLATVSNIEQSYIQKPSALPLKYYRLNSTAKAPIYATNNSACFDLSLSRASEYKFFTEVGPHDIHMVTDRNDQDFIEIRPYCTGFLPTGLIFEIPEGYYMRLYLRSSLAAKMGLILTNSVGIIDEDYRDQIFVMVRNMTAAPQAITFGDRIAQAELVQRLPVKFEELTKVPKLKGNRVGGLGSTGTK